MKKTLFIDVNQSEPTCTTSGWNDISSIIKNSVEHIKTNVNEETDFNALVTGIPTPFARAILFKDALNKTQSATTEQGDMNKFYGSLCDEWRGLIACIALEYQNINVERVWLRYSDGKKTDETANVYEPSGAFGNMLFRSRELWCAKGGDVDNDHRDVPFIDIIKYNNKVVGANSPETLLFTAVSYKFDATEQDKPFVDYNRKSFTDPQNNPQSFDGVDVMKLYAYVKNLKTNLQNLTIYYSDLGLINKQHDDVRNNLEKWVTELENYAKDHGVELSEASIPSVNKFMVPFSNAFNHETKLFGKNGNFSVEATEGALEINPKDLLLGEDSELARVIIDAEDEKNLDRLPVYLLPASIAGDEYGKAYFSLPLSSDSLNAFGNNLNQLVNGDVNIGCSLTAKYDPNTNNGNLDVTLTLVTDKGQKHEFMRKYTVKQRIQQQDILMWPNFVSEKWNRYFLFSELPHNTRSASHYPFRAMPFVGNANDDLRIITDKITKQPIYLAENGKETDKTDFLDSHGNESATKLSAKLLIKLDDSATEGDYQYEIYESNCPFKGVRLVSANDKEAGLLVIKYGNNNESEGLPMNKVGALTTELRESTIGIDFGSTNTSIAYLNADSEACDMTFKNRCISMFHTNMCKQNMVPNESKLFFFPQNEVKTNSLKSIITLHDPHRLQRGDNETGDVAMYEKEVKGGFPCLSNNLPIDTIERDIMHLKTGRSREINLKYNMKWNEEPRDIAYKKSYLKGLMLQVYAELFMLQLHPKKLKWSYPSSMQPQTITGYAEIWESLSTINPLTEKDKYMLRIASRNMSQLNSNTFDPFGGEAMPAAADNSFGNDPFSQPSNFGTDPFAQPANFGSDPFAQPASFGSDPFGNEQASAPAPENKSANPLEDAKDDDTLRVDFKPVAMTNKNNCESMTEACAVANYLIGVNKSVGLDGNELLLCFDIGGSTTDISAICNLRDKNGEVVPTMIKQNSVKFAAKLVSDATKKSRRFKEALVSTCDQVGLLIQGLNLGTDKYTSDTAPYYFEQLVDRLSDEQLPIFYKNIGTKCNDLMSVNLYVTGLITYYAGILTRKLVKQVKNSSENIWGGSKPKVKIVFAGKGARIMEWLSTVANPEFAKGYYRQMFYQGVGFSEVKDYLEVGSPEIVLPNGANSDVKYEVSKGLADSSTSLMRPTDNRPIEVIGEEGYMVKVGDREIELAADNKITPEMMKQIGYDFRVKNQQQKFGPRFIDFLKAYNTVAQNYFKQNIDPARMLNEANNLNAFIRGEEEYKKANPNKFEYVAPILILEGQCFYEKLIEQLGNN